MTTARDITWRRSTVDLLKCGGVERGTRLEKVMLWGRCLALRKRKVNAQVCSCVIRTRTECVATVTVRGLFFFFLIAMPISEILLEKAFNIGYFA